VWLLRGTWLDNALETGARINNLMGGLSFLAGLALWLTSLEAARRSSYDLFYKMHHIGFWGFLLFGCCHYWAMMWYFLPGLLLYGIDAVYRVWQATVERGGRVVGAHADGGVRVSERKGGGQGGQGGQEGQGSGAGLVGGRVSGNRGVA
jgi:DMSO/TMAO reductase YedYZ heme-binding membrane subunit